MSDPKVSIIYPFYNCEDFIKESLSYLAYLSSNNFEIIVINDGSNDNSLKVALEALESFTIDVLVISRITNQGCFKARTEAIGASRGRYIAIVDADDITYQGRLETQLDFLESNDDIFCCGGWAEEIDHNGKYLRRMDYPPLNNEKIIQKIISDPTSNPIIDPTTMFRKSVFYELGGYSFEDDRDLVADMDLWFRALLCDKKFHNIQESLIEYRQNLKGNTNTNKSKMIQQHVKVRKDFISRIKKDLK